MNEVIPYNLACQIWNQAKGALQLDNFGLLALYFWNYLLFSSYVAAGLHLETQIMWAGHRRRNGFKEFSIFLAFAKLGIP